MPCHSWSIHCALTTLGTWADLPSQVLGSGTHLWVHHIPTVLNASPLQGLHPAPPPPPWAHRNPQRASQAPGDTVGWGDAREQKMASCGESGTVPLFGSCWSHVPCQLLQPKWGIWCSSPFPAAVWCPAAFQEFLPLLLPCLSPHRFSLSRRRGPSLVLRPQCLSPESERSSNHASHDYLPLVRAHSLSPSPSWWGHLPCWVPAEPPRSCPAARAVGDAPSRCLLSPAVSLNVSGDLGWLFGGH